MREAAIPGYRLSKAKLSTKVLTTFGILGLLLGLLGAIAMTIYKTGLSANDVSTYYLGKPIGGQSELAELDEMIVASTPRPVMELVEITHLHILGGSMMLFFLCHLLSVCSMSERKRVAIYSIAFSSFLSTFLLPWLIIFVSSAFAYIYGPIVVLFLASLILLCLLPMYEMWR